MPPVMVAGEQYSGEELDRFLVGARQASRQLNRGPTCAALGKLALPAAWQLPVGQLTDVSQGKVHES